MLALSKFFGAIPLLVANCYKNNQYLKNETLYNRHYINAINLQTLKNLLENNISPYKIAMRGSSISIKMNGIKLKKALDSVQGINTKTKSEISKKLDISRQSLSNYESGQSLPTEDTFKRILNFFNEITKEITKDDLIEPINLLDPKNIADNEISQEKIDELNLKGFRSEVNDKLKELQFDSQWFQKLPWDGVSIDKAIKSKKLLFFTGLGEREQIEPLLSRINSTETVIKLFNNKSIWIIQDEKIIPDLQNSLKDRSSHIKILSFHDLPELKKEKN